MKKVIYSWGVYLILTLTLYSQSISLAEYLEKVKLNNPEILSFKKQYEASLNTISYFYLLKDPLIEFEKMNTGNMPEKSFYIKQEIENPLKLKYNYNIKEKEYKYLKANYEKKKNQILTLAKLSYYQYLHLLKQKEIYEKILLNIELIIESLKSDYLISKTSLNDIMKLELKYSEIKNEINIIDSKEKVEFFLSNMFIGGENYSFDTYVDENPVFDNNFSAFLEELDNNPELLSKKIEIQKAELEYKLSKAYYYPDLMFGYKKRYENASSYDIMVGFSLPIFLNKNKSYKNEKEKILESLKKEYEAKYLETRYLLEKYFRQTERNYQSFKYYKDVVLNKSNALFELSLSSYKSGNTNLIEVLYAIDENIKVKLKYYEYLFEFYKSKALLDEVCGRVL